MTPNQSQCLKFIKSYIDENGLSPTIGEISKAMGMKSRTGSAGLVDKLETDGHITRCGDEARNIRIKDQTQSPLEMAVKRVIASKIGEVMHGNDNAVLIPTAAFNALKSISNQ